MQGGLDSVHSTRIHGDAHKLSRNQHFGRSPRQHRISAPLHARTTQTQGRVALDERTGRTRDRAVFCLRHQRRPSPTLSNHRRRPDCGNHFYRSKNHVALHHHGHRLPMGKGRLRGLLAGARLLLGRRGQLCRVGAAHGLPLLAFHNRAGTAPADVPGAHRLCDLRRQRDPVCP